MALGRMPKIFFLIARKPAGREKPLNPGFTTLDTFTSHKNRTITKPDGKCFPFSEKASRVG